MTTGLRIDKWLWFARFCKTRSLAQHLLEGGEVRLNGRPVAKAGNVVKPGDEVVLPKGRGWLRVRVLAVGVRRGPAPEARLLYQELPAAPADPA
jgi:ribosome-associated heat shock protein Hsp15